MLSNPNSQVNAYEWYSIHTHHGINSVTDSTLVLKFCWEQGLVSLQN